MTKNDRDPAGQAIEFALFAPCNESVELIGDAAGKGPVPMTKGDDGWWRTSVALFVKAAG